MVKNFIGWGIEATASRNVVNCGTFAKIAQAMAAIEIQGLELAKVETVWLTVNQQATQTRRRLTCNCCGSDAGIWKQFHNQDTGFGLCPKCRDWIWDRNRYPSNTQANFERTYGAPGVNYAPCSATHAEVAA